MHTPLIGTPAHTPTHTHPLQLHRGRALPRTFTLTLTLTLTLTPYRYVELFRVNRGEMLQALEQFVGGYLSNNHMPQMMPMGGAMGGNGPPYPDP